ncbi:MAG: hypothetical protein KAX78_08195 [Phycisphaerae bacterium]|nr:hypothetical protein [Phycisphaerae bacterium]
MQRKRTLMALVATVIVGMIVAGQVISQQTQPAGRTERGRDARGQQDADQMRERIERFRQRAAERMKEQLAVSDEEWKVLSPRIEKVQGLLRDSQGRQMRGRDRARSGRRDAAARERTADREQTDVEKKSEALRTLLENQQAKPAEIKSAMSALRKARDKSRQELVPARKELREVVTLRQEAQLVLMGLLD